MHELNLIFARFLTTNFLKFSPFSNCADDADVFLEVEIPSNSEDAGHQCNTISETEIDLRRDSSHACRDCLENVAATERLDVEEASMRYFVGYVAFKILERNSNCQLCRPLLIKDDEQITCQSEFFIFIKNFSQNSTFGKLHAPTNYFLNLCKLHFSVFQKFFKDYIEIKNIKATIESECIRVTKDSDSYSDWFNESHDCFYHRKDILSFAILVLLRKHCTWRTSKFIKSKNPKIQSLL